MAECVRLMRETFDALRDGSAQNQSRRRLVLPTGSMLHAMAGSIGKYFGTKVYSAHAKYGAYFFFHLFDAETAKPLALMQANYLGQIRTGAASGYATDVLADPQASTVGLIGSGFQARAQIEAILAVRAIREVRVWSRSEEKRRKFAEECSAAFKISVKAADSAEEAVRNADIVATATWAKDPVIESAWVKDGAHVNAMGSNQATRREIPADLVNRATLIAVDSIEQAKIESGDLLLAWKPEDWQTSRLIELKDAAGSKHPPGITIFKSNGLGVEDVSAGGFVYERASSLGIGSALPGFE